MTNFRNITSMQNIEYSYKKVCKPSPLLNCKGANVIMRLYFLHKVYCSSGAAQQFECEKAER